MRKLTGLFVGMFLGVVLIFAGCKRFEEEITSPAGLGNPEIYEKQLPGVSSHSYEVRGDTLIFYLTFTKYMDSASVVDGVDIEKYYQDAGGSTSVISKEYYPKLRELKMKILMAETTGFIVKVSSSVKDAWGNPFDGNDNGFVDGSPWDDWREFYYRRPSWVVPAPDLESPEVDDVYFENGSRWKANPEDTLYVEFSEIINMGTLTSSTIFIMDYSGNTYSLSQIDIDTTLSGKLKVAYTYSLSNGTPYMLIILPEVEDTAGNYLGVSPRDTFKWSFVTEISDTEQVVYPEVTNAYISGNKVVIKFNKKLDASTVNIDNIKVYENSDHTGFVYGSVILNDTNEVWYTLENTSASPLYLYVSKEVKSADGYKLDGNGNGVGGEPDDDYETTVY